MTTTTSNAYSWIKRIPSALLQKDRVPLLGFPPSFPWEQFSKKLAELFSISELSIEPSGPVEWRSEETLYTGIGDQLKTLNLTLAPLAGNISWVMPEENLAMMISLLLTSEPQSLETFDPDFLQGFYRFLSLEAINAFKALEYGKILDPHILENSDLPKETSLCLDIEMKIKSKSLWGRLIISSEFLENWRRHFAQRNRILPIAQDLEVTVHLEAGHTTLNLSEWKAVKVEDFLILDFCSLKSGGEGRIMLTVEGHPLFRGKVKDGKIKILEHPLYHEVNTPMAKDLPADESQADSETDFSFFEDEEEEFKEEEASEEALQFQETDAPQEEELPPAEELPEEVAEAPLETPPETSPPPIEEKKPFTPEEISLTIVVEVGRLQMSVGKLMELQPGNILDLSIHPENGVDLVVNGNKIAKGELLLIGETLGVRILDK